MCDNAQTGECRQTNVLNAGIHLRIYQLIYSKRKGAIMNTTLIHRMCIVVLGAALCLQTSVVMAEIVPTDQLAAPNQTEVEKAKVQAFMDRADVKDRLQALGVNELSAKDRVAAMTDQEVHAMAQKIDSMPAGGTLSNNDLLLVLVIVLILLLI
jgi:hypothetical protein